MPPVLAGEPGRSLCQDVALHLQLAHLASQARKLFALSGRQAFLAGQRLAGVDRHLRRPIHNGLRRTAKLRDSSAGVRPARTSSTICWRNSAGYGGWVLGILDSFLPKNEVSAEAGQLQDRSGIFASWCLHSNLFVDASTKV